MTYGSHKSGKMPTKRSGSYGSNMVKKRVASGRSAQTRRVSPRKRMAMAGAKRK